jgi:hypothetical protein
VPIYQRHYVWTEAGQWAGLWEDLRAKAEVRLDKDKKYSRHPHYMGALVLEARSNTSSREVPIVDVIDGQQRLTTLQIILIALRDISTARKNPTMAKIVERCILNEHPDEMRDPDTEIHKLWPTHHDRDIFLRIQSARSQETIKRLFVEYFTIRTGRLSKIGKKSQPNLLQAYIFFYDAMDAFVEGEGEELVASSDRAEVRLDAILTALMEDFRVVEIQLEKDDDAQVIFETLNDRGTPLLAADLIRNFIFLRASRGTTEPEKLYEARWKSFEDPFWSIIDSRGRLTRQRIEFFLLQYLSASTGREISLIRLFAEYKDFVQRDERPLDMNAEVDDILRFAPHYRVLIEPSGIGPLSDVARRLAPWDVSTTFPPILALAVSELDNEEKAIAFSHIVSYIVRRGVCGLTTKNYNNIFLGLVRKMIEVGASSDAVKDYLLGQHEVSSRWPNDTEFKDAWIESPLYNNLIPSVRLRSILLELEFAIRTGKTDPAPVPSMVSIEHLMPQSWYDNWPMPDGSSPTPQERINACSISQAAEKSSGRTGVIAQRERLLHTVGNLTLHSQSLGSSIGNVNFAKKQAAFRKHGLFQITKGFTAPEITAWDENAIRARGQTLFELALRLWPRPGAFTKPTVP